MSPWEEAVTWLIEQPEHQELAKQCYFDRPVSVAVERYAASDEWQAVQALLPSPPGTALDVGAGNGIVSYALARAGWRVDALEPDPSGYVGAEAIRSIAKQHQLPIAVSEAYGEQLPYPASAFDLIIARQVAHHARDLPAMFRELARVLRPGGRLLVLRDHVIDDDAGKEVFLMNHPLHRHYGGENAFRLDEYTNAIEEAGLSIQQRLLQFDSVINLAPRSVVDVCDELAARVPLKLCRPAIKACFSSKLVWPILRRVLNLGFRRPGRLVSFVCAQPPTAGDRNQPAVNENRPAGETIQPLSADH